jgi:hypothetical protein
MALFYLKNRCQMIADFELLVLHAHQEGEKSNNRLLSIFLRSTRMVAGGQLSAAFSVHELLILASEDLGKRNLKARRLSGERTPTVFSV